MKIAPFLVSSLVLATGGGCKDKSKDAPATGAPGAPATPGTAPTTVTSDLALLANDAELVLGLDWQQLQASTIWKQVLLPLVMKESEVVSVISEIKNRCDIDLTTAPKHITLGVKGLEDEVPDGGVVVTGLDKAKVMACPDKFKAEADKEHVVVTRDGEMLIALDGDGYGMGVTFIGERALFMIGHSMSNARFKTAIAGTGSLASSQAFMDMHGKIDTSQTAWGFFHGATMEKEVAEILGTKPKAIYGSIATKQGVSAQVRARVESPEVATKTVEALREAVKGAGAQVDKAEIAADGQDIKLDVAAAGAKLEALIKSMAE